MNSSLSVFQDVVWQYYHGNGRHDLPWRQPEADGTFDSYKIVVSELMLQQTQVSRVIPKYHAFIRAYPSFADLAAASLGDVLRLWSGLGYNRRAKFLWQTAKEVTGVHHGALPQTVAGLTTLPGIGPHTAGAILAYAFNQPAMFVETNIRTVYIHHFFADATKVPDSQVIPLLVQTVPQANPREWYWALMDYGAYLKQTVGNLTRASASYNKQSAFHGSRRQVRGQVLRLLAGKPLSGALLKHQVADARLPEVLIDLTNEELIERKGSLYRLRS